MDVRLRPSGVRRRVRIFCRIRGLAHLARERIEAHRRYSGVRVNALILATSSGRRSRQSFNMDSRSCSRSRVCIERSSPAILRARISGLRQVARVARDRGEDRLRIPFATSSACSNSRGESNSVKGCGSAGLGVSGTSPSIRLNTASKSKPTTGTRAPSPRSSSTHPNGDAAWSGWCSLNFSSFGHELSPVVTALQALEFHAEIQCLREVTGRRVRCGSVTSKRRHERIALAALRKIASRVAMGGSAICQNFYLFLSSEKDSVAFCCMLMKIQKVDKPIDNVGDTVF